MSDQRITAGVHLPQAGPAASGEALRRAAILAEDLGFADVWVSDHVVLPRDAPYPPSSYILEPLVALTEACLDEIGKAGALNAFVHQTPEVA